MKSISVIILLHAIHERSTSEEIKKGDRLIDKVK